MQKYITNNDHVIWDFPADGGDETATGLDQIPEITGVGNTIYIAFDQHKVLFEQNYEWEKVDPATSKYDAQLFQFTTNELATLKEFVTTNTPLPSFMEKVRRKQPQASDFVCMVKAIIDYHEEKSVLQFFLYG